MRRKRRLKKRKPFFAHKLFWIGFAFVACAGFLAYFLLFFPYFQIHRVVATGAARGEDMAAKVQAFVPRTFFALQTRSIFFFSQGSMEELVQREFPEVERARVFRDFPSTLVIRVIERKEIAQWCSKDSCFALDANGIVFMPDSSQAFLKLMDSKEVALGQKVIDSSLLATILEFQKRAEQIDPLKEAGARMTGARIVSKERVNFSLSEGWSVYLNPTEPLDWQVTKLRLVLEKKVPLERRKLLEYVDVRFGNQAYLKYR